MPRASAATIADVRDVYVPRQDHRSTHSAMIMAMHWAPDANTSDTLRLREMMADDWSIATADTQGPFDTGDKIGHVNIWFKPLKAITRLVQDYPLAQAYILDYYWLQWGYYESNYGENWDEKAEIIFKSGSRPRVVILPIDAVEDPKRQTSSMRQQMKGLKKRGLTYFELDADDVLHPLVKASIRCEQALLDRSKGLSVGEDSIAMADYSNVTKKEAAELVNQDRVHSKQSMRTDGFVAIVRKGTIRRTRAWLRMC